MRACVRACTHSHSMKTIDPCALCFIIPHHLLVRHLNVTPPGAGLKVTPFFRFCWEESINFFSKIQPCLKENEMSPISCFISLMGQLTDACIQNSFSPHRDFVLYVHKLLNVHAIKIAQGVVSLKRLFIYIQIYTFYNVY